VLFGQRNGRHGKEGGCDQHPGESFFDYSIHRSIWKGVKVSMQLRRKWEVAPRMTFSRRNFREGKWHRAEKTKRLIPGAAGCDPMGYRLKDIEAPASIRLPLRDGSTCAAALCIAVCCCERSHSRCRPRPRKTNGSRTISEGQPPLGFLAPLSITPGAASEPSKKPLPFSLQTITFRFLKNLGP
jgi:hypothetical protein